MSLHVTHLTFVKSGEEQTMIEFESKVLPLLKKYGAEILVRVRPDHTSIIETNVGEPFEIHVIRFQSEADLKSYLSDPERQALLPLKDKAISKSMTFISPPAQ